MRIAYVIIGMVLLTITTILGINLRHSTLSVSAKPQPVLDQSKSVDLGKVKALKIAEMKRDGDFIRVYFKNISDKEVNGLTLLFKDYSTITTDYTISGDGILPGGLKELTIPAEMQTDSKVTNYTLEQPFFDVMAVVFTDQTGEGDPQYISKIKDRRRGLKIQFEKLLPEFFKLPSEAETTLVSKLKETKEKISALPKEDIKESVAFQQGLRDGRSDLLEFIEALENEKSQKQFDFGKFRESLNDKIDKIKARINRL